MEYSDSLIASAEDFAKMAKEYSSRLKREKSFFGTSNEGDKDIMLEIIWVLKDMIWLYGYIKRNIRSIRLKSIFSHMEEESKADLKEVENLFYLSNAKSGTGRPKRPVNFSSCVKLAISNETDLLNKIINLNYQNEDFTKNFLLKHLDFIKKLSNF